LALEIKIAGTPARYLQSLDKPTRKRIKEKLLQIAENPQDLRLSYPLTSSDKRSARVGQYRILFKIDSNAVLVVHIAPRGQVYRKA
jgi:mRNA-degrading endonuclease RelE of RelBE toxin-antitoxin system